MNKKQKLLKFLKKDSTFLVSIIFLTVILFCILSPKISSMLFIQRRQSVLNGFLSTTLKSKTIDPQSYWQFREFYSPGGFNFSRTGISESLLKDEQTKINIQYNQDEIDLTFLAFNSPRLNSIDMLTKEKNLNKIINENVLGKDNILFINQSSLIYQQNSNTIVIIFLKNESDMKKANGFFDYQDKDKNITAGENWFNITSVEIN